MKNDPGMWNNVTSIFSSNKNNPSEGDDIETGDYTSLIKKNISNTIEVQTSYKSFFIAIGIGLGFILLSLIFLPMLAFAPQKFLTLFSIGSFIIILSFIFIHGTSAYFEILFSRERFIFTFFYFGSLILSLYTAFIKEFYLLSLISIAVQVITLIIFCLSFIPGGKSGINILLTILFSPINSYWNKITGK